MNRKLNPGIGRLGRQLDALFKAKRRSAYEELERKNRVRHELQMAERYFVERMAKHNADYAEAHPRPNKIETRMRWLQSREAYVATEVAREMENWVINYPKVNAKSA